MSIIWNAKRSCVLISIIIEESLSVITFKSFTNEMTIESFISTSMKKILWSTLNFVRLVCSAETSIIAHIKDVMIVSKRIRLCSACRRHLKSHIFWAFQRISADLLFHIEKLSLRSIDRCSSHNKSRQRIWIETS